MTSLSEDVLSKEAGLTQEPGRRQRLVQAPRGSLPSRSDDRVVAWPGTWPTWAWIQGLRVLAATTPHLACCVPWAGCCSSQAQYPLKFPKRVRGDSPRVASSSRSSIQSSHSAPGHAGYLEHHMFSLEIPIFSLLMLDVFCIELGVIKAILQLFLNL